MSVLSRKREYSEQLKPMLKLYLIVQLKTYLAAAGWAAAFALMQSIDYLQRFLLAANQALNLYIQVVKTGRQYYFSISCTRLDNKQGENIDFGVRV